MIDDYLKKQEVIDFIDKIKEYPKYNLKNGIDSTNYDENIGNELSLYILYDALLKYKIIIDDDDLFGIFIEQLDKIFKKIDGYENVLIGINKLICYIVIKHLKITDVKTEENRNSIISFVYDKYISNGYYVHGFNSVYEKAIKENGFVSEVYQNNYVEMNSIKEIFNKYKIDAIKKDFSLNKTFFTDDFIMGCYYSAMSPGYFSGLLFNQILYGNKLRLENYLKPDYDASISDLKRFLNNKSFSDKEKKYILDVVSKEWNYLNTSSKRICLLLVKRNRISSEYKSKIEDFLNDKSDVYEIVDRMLNSKYANVAFDGVINAEDILIASFDNFYSKKEKVEKPKEIDQNIDKMMKVSLENQEFLDSYGKVYIFLIISSLLISLGVIISLIFTVRGI